MLQRHVRTDLVGAKLDEPRVLSIHEADERRRRVVEELSETTDVGRLRHDEEVLDGHAHGQHFAQPECFAREEQDAACVRMARLPDDRFPLLGDPRQVGGEVR